MGLANYNDRVVELQKKTFYQGRNIGHYFPRGWLDLIEKMVQDLEALPFGDRLYCSQQKEKLGSLRVYYSIDSKGLSQQEFDDLREAALKIILDCTDASETTCMRCGKPGYYRDGSWILVLCDEHEATKEQDREQERQEWLEAMRKRTDC